MTKSLTIILLILIVNALSVAGVYAERWDYNWDTSKMDKVLDKAEEISVNDPNGYYGSTASPPTVQSALQDIASGLAVVPYLKLDASNDPLTGNLALGADSSGQGLSVFSGVAGEYWEWLNNGNVNAYGQTDMTLDAFGTIVYDGYSNFDIAGIPITSDETILTTKEVTASGVKVSSIQGLILKDSVTASSYCVEVKNGVLTATNIS